MTSRTWLDACREFADAHDIPSHTLDLLHAFASPWPRGGPPPPPEPAWTADFAALERRVAIDDAFAGIASDLVGEIGAVRAQMFACRTAAVDRELAEIDRPAARLLRVGLRWRLAGILADRGPRALRVGALAGFYDGHACRLRARPVGDARALTDLVASARWHEVAPGLTHAHIEGEALDGPVHVHALAVDPRRIAIDVIDCRADAEAGIPFADTVARHGAIAATSGGFFLDAEPDIEPPSRRHDPVGLLVEDGRVRSPPVFTRGALVVDRDGRADIDRIGLPGTAIVIGAHRFAIERATNRAHALVASGTAIVGDRVVAVGAALEVPLAGAVIEPCGLAPGDAVHWQLAPARSGAPIRSAIAGGPVLLAGGAPVLDLRGEDFWGTAPPFTFAQDETGDRNLLPRLAVGRRDDGVLVFVAVDGCNGERALGMTLGDVASLLRTLGCTDGLNLDGGSSKRMVLRGRTLDLPSADPATRPVHTAVLLRGR